jgi:hypothetical protein
MSVREGNSYLYGPFPVDQKVGPKGLASMHACARLKTAFPGWGGPHAGTQL